MDISWSLMDYILKYYNNEINKLSEIISEEYEFYKETDYELTLYKTDEEVRNMLPELYQKIESANESYNLCLLADTYIYWSDIIKIDNRHVIEYFRKKLHDILWKEATQNMSSHIDVETVNVFPLNSEKTRLIGEEEFSRVLQLV